MTESIFRSAITGDDGTVDPGYLAIYGVMFAVLGVIPFMCLIAAIAMFLDPAHTADLQGLGIGIGSLCTGAGVVIGAVGAFRMGDKGRPPPTVTVYRDPMRHCRGESHGGQTRPDRPIDD